MASLAVEDQSGLPQGAPGLFVEGGLLLSNMANIAAGHVPG